MLLARFYPIVELPLFDPCWGTNRHVSQLFGRQCRPAYWSFWTSNRSSTQKDPMADTASPSTSTSNTDSSSGYRYWVREGTAPKSAPKKLEAENSAPAAQVGSAWNHAGTFEERDFSKWAKTFLEKAFQGISITVSGAKFSVSDVPKVNGEVMICCDS